MSRSVLGTWCKNTWQTEHIRRQVAGECQRGKKWERSMNLFDLLTVLSLKKQFKKPCKEWLYLIESMCNEILGNYTKKEYQLMTVAFCTRPKRRLNRVMDALNFDYPDYEKLDKGVEGVKRKRVVSILSRQAARMVKEDEKISKKTKSPLSRRR
jgi:hypothetical protein